MAVATSTLAAASLAVAAAGAGYGVYAGENAATAQRAARRRQEESQREALRIQLAERTRSVQAEQRADRPTPASTVAFGEQLMAGRAATSGVDDRLKLARPSKLGGGT